MPRYSPKRRLRSAALEVDSEGSWAISYGDMVTLLLTFFILFFSLDSTPQKYTAIQDALVSALTQLDANASAKTAEDILQAMGGKKDSDLAVGTESDKGVVEFEAAEFGGKIYKIGQQLVIEFPSVSFFDFGKIELTESGKKSLKSFVGLFTPFAGTHFLGIRAFTDDTPVKKMKGKRFEDNLELSALRSVATMRALQASGIPLNRMKLGGYGELRETHQVLRDAKKKLESERKLASVNPETEEDSVDSYLKERWEGGRSKGVPLSRKIVLVIEPEEIRK